MKKIRILSFIVTVCMLICILPSAGVLAFSDVSAQNLAWAVNEINEMTSAGIIKGYTDGTFRPNQTVTKLEALVLTSRVLGVDDPQNEPLTSLASELYGDTIDSYKLTFGQDEVAYLLLKNIITESELSDYIGSSNASEGMKRYEVAVLLTKALDAENEVSKNVITSLEYADASSIPAYAKKYVEYVTNNGIMQGVDSNNFSPDTDVTRAQAAVLLSKIMKMTNYTYQTGQVSYIDTASRVLKIKNSEDTTQYSVSASVLLRYEGTSINISDISTGLNAVLTLKGNSLYAIDFISQSLDEEVYGSVTGTSSSSDTGSISVNVLDNNSAEITSTNKKTYKLSKDCVITNEDGDAALNAFKSGSYVKITVKGGKAVMINGLAKTSTVSGRISNIELSPLCKMYIELNGGDEADYLVSGSVTVTKNGSKTDVSDIVIGDSVSVTTNYGRITKIVATSKSQTKSGIISEVIISESPRLTLKVEGEKITYPVANNCTFDIPGKAEPCFYDLRAGSSATVTIEGDTIVEIKTDVSDGVTQLTGTVTSVNTSYGVIQISYVDTNSGQSVSEPVFVKSKATIVDISSGSTLKLSAITVGAKITAFGSRNSGVFEATIVNVLSN